MDYFKIFYSSLLSVVVLFLLTKILGKKQIAQLTMFDYINGITIGSIAAEVATNLENSPLKPLLAMIIYALVTLIMSIVSNKSIKARRFFTGKSAILFDKNKLYVKNLESAKMDVDELLMQARGKGYFNLSDIESAILESNGSISFLPKSSKRPASPQDMGIPVTKEKLQYNVIMDGNIMTENLKAVGKNTEWINNQLKEQNISSYRDVFLAFCDENSQLTVYKNNNQKIKNDIFE